MDPKRPTSSSCGCKPDVRISQRRFRHGSELPPLLSDRGHSRAHDGSSEAPTPGQRRRRPEPHSARHRTAPHRHLPPKAPRGRAALCSPRSPPGEATLAQAHKETGTRRTPLRLFMARPGFHTEVPSAGCSGCPSFFFSSGFIAGNSSTSCENGHQDVIAHRRARSRASLARPLLLRPALRQARDTGGAGARRRGCGHR